MSIPGGGAAAGGGRRKMSVSVGAGRRGSVVAGLEMVPPATVIFHSITVSTRSAVHANKDGGSGAAADDDGAAPAEKTTVLLRGAAGIARAGELVAVMGPSGSGKTSLLTSLAGGTRTAGRDSIQISGSLEINGEKKALGSLVSSRIASFVTQEECLLPGLTVRCVFSPLSSPRALADPSLRCLHAN